MKYILLVSLFISTIFANEYYAKLEPVESFQVKSTVSGKVVFSNDKLEGKRAQNSKVIEIDSYVNKVELEQTRNKLKAINSMIEIENNNYKRMLKVSSKSGFEKDSQKLKVINLKTTQADLLIKIATLKDTIKNKKLIEKNKYIYNIVVKKDDYVTPGTLLYEAKDLTQAKLEIFVPIADIEVIKNKSIYIDGTKSDLKINKIYEVADSKHISSYKVELIINEPKTFSRLVKIEFK